MIKKTKPLLIITGIDIDSQKITVVNSDNKSQVLLFPEAMQHPKKQLQLARELVRRVNSGEHFIVFTHSDYIVKELNNCIMLGHVEDLNKTLEYVNINRDAPEHYTADHILKNEDIECYIVGQTINTVNIDLQYGMDTSAFDSEVIGTDKAANAIALNIQQVDKFGFIKTTFDDCIAQIVQSGDDLAAQIK